MDSRGSSGALGDSASGSTMALIGVITISIMQAESSHKCLGMTDRAGRLAQTLLANQHPACTNYISGSCRLDTAHERQRWVDVKLSVMALEVGFSLGIKFVLKRHFNIPK